MANSRTTEDLIKGALKRAGEVDTGTSKKETDALKYINLAYLSLLAGSSEFNLDVGEPWYWARELDPIHIILKAPFETGTVSLTNGSSAGVFSDAPIVSMKGRHLRVTDRSEVFVIKTHIANQAAFTLECAYTDESSTALTFKAIKLRYDLGNEVLRLIEPFRIYKSQSNTDDEDKVYGMVASLFRREYPLRKIGEGVPTYFSIINQSEDEFFVEFNSYVDADTKVDIEYVKIPDELEKTATSVPIVPVQHRIALEYMTAAMLLTDKRDGKSSSIHFNLANGKIKSMNEEYNKQSQHISKSRGKVVPRLDLV